MFWILIVLAIAMWVLQGILSVFQLKKFNRELKRLRKSGRVAIGKNALPLPDARQTREDTQQPDLNVLRHAVWPKLRHQPQQDTQCEG